MDKRIVQCTILGFDGSENDWIVKFEVCSQVLFWYLVFTAKRKKEYLKIITKKAISKFFNTSDKLAHFPAKWASSKFLLKIPNVLDLNDWKLK